MRTIVSLVSLSFLMSLWSCKQQPANNKVPQSGGKQGFNSSAIVSRPAITQTKTPTPVAPRANPSQGGTDWWAFRQWSWEGTPVGTLPSFLVNQVGVWKVLLEQEQQKKVLAQIANHASSVFNLALIHSVRMLDMEISVQLRAITGKIDQGGGLVWRAKDAKNYYIARYNPLEDNLRVYTVQQGQRKLLQSADIRLDRKSWHTLRVTMQGQQIQVFLDQKKYLDVADATFQEAGMIGLWTKADAQTYFRDWHTKPLVSMSLGAHELSPSQANTYITKQTDVVILDVRTSQEYAAFHIEGATNIDVTAKDFRQKAAQLDKSKKYLIHCAAGVPGGRSHLAFMTLHELNVPSVHHIRGGIVAWKQTLPVVEQKKEAAEQKKK